MRQTTLVLDVAVTTAFSFSYPLCCMMQVFLSPRFLWEAKITRNSGAIVRLRISLAVDESVDGPVRFSVRLQTSCARESCLVSVVESPTATLPKCATTRSPLWSATMDLECARLDSPETTLPALSSRQSSAARVTR